MSALTRSEHVAWCKQRATPYVDAGDLTNALASMASDMTKHPETDTPALPFLMLEGMRLVMAEDAQGLRRWIEGFG